MNEDIVSFVQDIKKFKDNINIELLKVLFKKYGVIKTIMQLQFETRTFDLKNIYGKEIDDFMNKEFIKEKKRKAKKVKNNIL